MHIKICILHFGPQESQQLLMWKLMGIQIKV